MIYQVGLIAILVVFALIVAKRFGKSKIEDKYIYEDEMDPEELENIDKELD
jgi:hypothetical protein|tara:strand:+ start:15304 stop:15456 length:153 start_codon:yes stop_codon:yes gene_type:complete